MKKKQKVGDMRAAMDAAGVPADMTEAAEYIMGRAPIDDVVGEILLAFVAAQTASDGERNALAEAVNAIRSAGGVGPIRCGTDAVIAAAIKQEGR